jgi:hypothetical protein
MRALLAVLALAALTAGCGSPAKRSEPSAPKAGSLEALWKSSGQAVALIPGTNDYSAGDLRISFLVVNNRGRVIDPPTAHFWIGRSLSAKPFQKTLARLVPVGVAGVSKNSDVPPALYVAHVHVDQPGTYYVVARPVGAVAIGGVRDLVVKDRSVSPPIDSRAYASQTPTLTSTGGKIRELTTRVPPDRGLLRYSIAESLAAHAPFVVTFATPRYCQSRTCGPVVDVVDHVRRRFEGAGIRFIHVEIYKDNDPRKGQNQWVRQWHLPSEPWTFLVGRDGRIKAKFEGAVSTGELDGAIRRFLR